MNKEQLYAELDKFGLGLSFIDASDENATEMAKQASSTKFAVDSLKYHETAATMLGLRDKLLVIRRSEKDISDAKNGLLNVVFSYIANLPKRHFE